jgi:excisionase family DNA binding protein
MPDVPIISELGPYVTAERAAQLAQCSEINIRKLLLRGHIRAVRWGDRTLMIDRASLDAYLASAPHPGRPRLK